MLTLSITDFYDIIFYQVFPSAMSNAQAYIVLKGLIIFNHPTFTFSQNNTTFVDKTNVQ